MLDDGAFDDPTAARHFVVNLRRSTDQLERRLADLVTLARYQTASLRPDQAASMRELVIYVVERIEPLAEATKVTVSAGAAGERAARSKSAPAPTDRVRCDPSAIGRALANLLENAVNATPDGRVTVEVGATDPDTVMVDVINEPARVPRAARSHLFERAPKSSEGRGSGLGLAMVRAAVEAHGGTVRFVEMGPPRVRVRLELPR